MTGVVLIFVVVFVLVMAAACSLLVLRMLGNLELPQSPPFPRRRDHAHRRHSHPATPDEGPAHPATVEPAGKR